MKSEVSDKDSVRWWSKVIPTEGCWHWIGNFNQKGYGRIQMSRKLVSAHRFGYEMLRGPIPGGLEIDHLCGNRSCMNPDHMEAVDHKTNVLRGHCFSAQYAARTECPKCGLPLAGDNLLVRNERGSRSRRCLNCKRASSRETARKMRARKAVHV